MCVKFSGGNENEYDKGETNGEKNIQRTKQ